MRSLTEERENPTPLAIASWTAANASAASLFATHAAAMAEVLRPGIEVEGDSNLARKTPFCEPFYTKNDQFTQTDSGQHIGKVEDKEMLMRFLQAKVINSSVLSLLTTYRASEHFGGSASGGLCGDAYAGGTGGGWDLETWQLPWCAKTVFESHLYIKFMILPRQARDKHRESTQTRDRFARLLLFYEDMTHRCEENASLFECFPYGCPEPVLTNTTVFHENPSWCGYASYSLLQYRIDRMAAASVIAHTTVGPPASKNGLFEPF